MEADVDIYVTICSWCLIQVENVVGVVVEALEELVGKALDF